MTDTIPAAPGSRVLFFDPNDPDGVTTVPVIGWTKMLNGFGAITLVPEDAIMSPGKAYGIPKTGDPNSRLMVVDPVAKMTFDSVADWVQYREGAKPATEGSGKNAKTQRVNLYIKFGEKVYKNKSFWHFKTGSDEFLFELDGGETCPEDSRVEKINRDAFYKARKLLDVVPYEELFVTSDKGPDEVVDTEAEDLI